MLPQVAPEQPPPDRLQITAVLVVFNTVAVNCCCSPPAACADRGETLTDTGSATVTTAEPNLEGSAIDVAATVT